MGKRRFAQVGSSEEEEESRSGDGRWHDRKMQMKSVELVESSASVQDQNCRGNKRDDGAEEREDGNGDARPVGSVIRISGKGTEMKKYYAAFEYNGDTYELEDSVLLTPEEECEKPFVAIIKEITQISTGNVMVNGQWLYRPEEAMEKGGGNWLTVDSRELFYSFHFDEVPAESVMHKCIVHFVPPHKQLPSRTKHPGFVVKRVYDAINQKLRKITDKGFADDKKNASNLCLILKQCRVCTGDRYRDKWLEKLLQGIQFVCQLNSMLVKDSDKRKDSTRKTMTISGGGEHIVWPDDAVLAVAALEKAVHEALCSDFQKYNQKMRQLDFNLKKNMLLAKRLLKKELEPSVLLSMSPSELKMTDARCSRCSEQNAGVVDIINAGGSGERYQLECTGCGRTWYAPADEVATLISDAPPNAAGDLGAKIDAVEKNSIGPRVPENPAAAAVLPESTAPKVPVAVKQRRPLKQA
ncbi:unnamed protein product [Spirodela intermedia]|uniref:Uncharacterized protein n=1 Tax=Spirodela intermedia TaxID=51605 RepID=A0A7I8ICV0_SPIIN|nr:unnamed protein product [Spirodela intermedia]CAA6655600.1 unnamed protein product [Spirodela intermedia]